MKRIYFIVLMSCALTGTISAGDFHTRLNQVEATLISIKHRLLEESYSLEKKGEKYAALSKRIAALEEKFPQPLSTEKTEVITHKDPQAPHPLAVMTMQFCKEFMKRPAATQSSKQSASPAPIQSNQASGTPSPTPSTISNYWEIGPIHHDKAAWSFSDNDDSEILAEKQATSSKYKENSESKCDESESEYDDTDYYQKGIPTSVLAAVEEFDRRYDHPKYNKVKRLPSPQKLLPKLLSANKSRYAKDPATPVTHPSTRENSHAYKPEAAPDVQTKAPHIRKKAPSINPLHLSLRELPPTIIEWIVPDYVGWDETTYRYKSHIVIHKNERMERLYRKKNKDGAVY